MRTSVSGTPLNVGQFIPGGATIYVDPILYDKLPAALFRANEIGGTNSTIDGTQAVFLHAGNVELVTILNNFDAPMIMLANDPTTPGVSISVLNVAPHADARGDRERLRRQRRRRLAVRLAVGPQALLPATDVQVKSIRGPPAPATTGYDLTINGNISNTIGSTSIQNDRGNIAVGAAAVFTSNQLNLDSDLGSIGSLANPVHAVLVQWDCSGVLFCSARIRSRSS